MMISRDEPFDKAVIDTLRQRADEHIDDPYSTDVPTMTWNWYARMVTSMERGLPKP